MAQMFSYLVSKKYNESISLKYFFFHFNLSIFFFKRNEDLWFFIFYIIKIWNSFKVTVFNLEKRECLRLYHNIYVKKGSQKEWMLFLCVPFWNCLHIIKTQNVNKVFKTQESFGKRRHKSISKNTDLRLWFFKICLKYALSQDSWKFWRKQRHFWDCFVSLLFKTSWCFDF